MHIYPYPYTFLNTTQAGPQNTTTVTTRLPITVTSVILITEGLPTSALSSHSSSFSFITSVIKTSTTSISTSTSTHSSSTTNQTPEAPPLQVSSRPADSISTPFLSQTSGKNIMIAFAVLVPVAAIIFTIWWNYHNRDGKFGHECSWKCLFCCFSRWKKSSRQNAPKQNPVSQAIPSQRYAIPPGGRLLSRPFIPSARFPDPRLYVRPSSVPPGDGIGAPGRGIPSVNIPPMRSEPWPFHQVDLQSHSGGPSLNEVSVFMSAGEGRGGRRNGAAVVVDDEDNDGFEIQTVRGGRRPDSRRSRFREEGLPKNIKVKSTPIKR